MFQHVLRMKLDPFFTVCFLKETSVSPQMILINEKRFWLTHFFSIKNELPLFKHIAWLWAFLKSTLISFYQFILKKIFFFWCQTFVITIHFFLCFIANWFANYLMYTLNILPTQQYWSCFTETIKNTLRQFNFNLITFNMNIKWTSKLSIECNRLTNGLSLRLIFESLSTTHRSI